ncbi:MAG: hypothetical protein R3322_15605 [Kiloniellales bacterium]|nr:hypothetical protein [Kiloniellales bacterium]
MAGREFDEVWDPDLMRQQLGELRKESARLKAELARARKTEDKVQRETSELRRLVQDGHLREKHLRARYHELLERSAAEPTAAAPGDPTARTDGGAEGRADERADRAAGDAAGQRAGERVDPLLVERLAHDEPPADGWPTPDSVLPTLAAHPGWGNYASKGEPGVVIGISLLGLDRHGRKEVIELVAAQQLRNPQLFPLFITDDDDFQALRAEHFVFEYLPPWPGEDVVESRERWEEFLVERLALIKKKWGVRRFVSFCSAGYDGHHGRQGRHGLGRGAGSAAGAEEVQRELSDAAEG